MFPLLRFLFVPLLLTTATSAQDAMSRAETALNVLQMWYNTSSGIWNTCGWWNGANCMTVLADLAAVDEWVRPTAVKVFANTFRVGPNSNPNPGREQGTTNTNKGGLVPFVHHGPLLRLGVGLGHQHKHKARAAHVVNAVGAVNASGWIDGAYDDDAWWALAWIGAYDVTGTPEYLELAMDIFDHLSKVWPTNCGHGGIYWDYTHTYVNAISNELFLSVAAHLANRASNRDYYIDWAQREWTWFETSGMINGNNTINDGLTGDCKNNGQTTWTYNQGVILGGLAELYRAVPDSSYLDAAAKIAKATIQALADSNKVIHEPCEPNCDGDATQFKGIFIRNLRLLHGVAPDDEYAQVIQACAESIWVNDRNSTNQMGVDWAGPLDEINASSHSSAMDALVAAIGLGRLS